MWLINNTWISTAMSGSDRLDGTIYIRVNPFVPNGWYEDDGSCDIGNRFDLKTVLKQLFLFGIRNLLVEGGDILTKSMLSKNLVNQFYLFKSRKNVSKSKKNIIFTSNNVLKSNYSIKYKISSKLAKDNITIYKR